MPVGLEESLICMKMWTLLPVCSFVYKTSSSYYFLVHCVCLNENSSKCRIGNLNSKSMALMEYTASVHSFHEKSQATQWGRKKAKLLPVVGNHQLSKRGFLPKQATACARHRSLVIVLNELQGGCWHRHDRRRRLEVNRQNFVESMG